MNVIPAVYQLDRLMGFLTLPNNSNNVTEKDNGNVLIKIDNKNIAIFRPQWGMIIPEKATQEEGLYRQDGGYSPLFYQIVKDENEVLWQQNFYPSVPDMEGLQAKATKVKLHEGGTLQFTFEGLDYQGVLDYFTTESFGLGTLTIKETDDANGDGIKDFKIFYPNGNTQLMFNK